MLQRLRLACRIKQSKTINKINEHLDRHTERTELTVLPPAVKHEQPMLETVIVSDEQQSSVLVRLALQLTQPLG